MGVSTGCERLDELLGGGLPDERSVLVRGPPGSGKTTIGMQFLQDGIEAGEDCLFVSTEQTIGELEDTFEPYPFDLHAEELTVLTVHAEPGHAVDGDGDLVVRTLEGGDRTLTEWFDLPFTRENVVEYIADCGQKERVLLDSVSGIRPIADDRISFWRSTYDLIRLFSSDFGATSLLTAEMNGHDVGSALVQYATHGVVSLDWERIGGQRHRFLRVEKLRGRDHDDRRHKLALTAEGIAVEPGRRTQSDRFLAHDHLSTGVPSLDDLLGGGLVRGGLTTVTHDGTTGYYTLLSRMLAAAIESGFAVAVAPALEVSLAQLDRYWRDDPWDVESLLDEGRLIALELLGEPDRDHRNVLVYDEDGGRDWQHVMERTYELAGDRPLFALIDTEPLLQRVSPAEAREVRSRAASGYVDEDDVVVYTINPKVRESALVEFFVDVSRQTIDVRRDEDGIEFLTVRKSPTGTPGASRVVSYLDAEPYVELV